MSINSKSFPDSLLASGIGRAIPKSEINTPHISTKTPQFLLRCDDVCDCEINDGGYMDNSAPITEFDFSLFRKETVDSSGENTQDGRIVGSYVTVSMRFGLWNPKFFERISKAIVIEKIEIHRMKEVAGELKPIAIYEYTNVHITWFRVECDILEFAFSYTTVTITVKAIDNTGKAIGSTAAQFDFEGSFSTT